MHGSGLFKSIFASKVRVKDNAIANTVLHNLNPLSSVNLGNTVGWFDIYQQNIWTNTAGNNLWSTAANWSVGVVPTANQFATFSGAYTYDNVYIDTNIAVHGILAKGFTGTSLQRASILAKGGSKKHVVGTGGITLNGVNAFHMSGAWILKGGI